MFQLTFEHYRYNVTQSAKTSTQIANCHPVKTLSSNMSFNATATTKYIHVSQGSIVGCLMQC